MTNFLCEDNEFNQNIQCASALNAVTSDINSHSAVDFESALSVMSGIDNKDFIAFPMGPEIFNLNINIDPAAVQVYFEQLMLENNDDEYQQDITSIPPYVVKVFNMDESKIDINYEINLFFKDIGNNDVTSAAAALKLTKELNNIKNTANAEYEVVFKLSVRLDPKVIWHKDTNNGSGLPMYNIAIALTPPGTWFCNLDEEDRVGYDDYNWKLDEELNKKCEEELLYQAPDFSGVIFRSSDNYSAVHSTPPNEGYRLFVLGELTPRE